MSGCGNKKLEPVYETETEHTELVPVSTGEVESYEGEEPVTETVEDTYTTMDGLVSIEKRASYYEVWIQLEQGSHYDCGKAYAQAIESIFPEFANVMEPYLYENVKTAFQDLRGDYTVLEKRLNDLLPQLPEEYRKEMQGFADEIAGETEGFVLDGVFSQEEVMLLNLIPDLLRPTQCSGAAVYGDKSATGSTITARILEWGLGNENQMAKAQAVVHFEQGDESFTSFTVLGLLDALSVYNDDGVFLAILDAGNDEIFTAEGRSSYTFAVRTAVEEYSDAKSAADYLASVGHNMTFAHNVLATDSNCAYVAEICPNEEVGYSAVRNADSELMNGLTWNNKDSICVVNGFALKDNYDNMTGVSHNLLRWSMFDDGLSAYDKVSVSNLKDILTKNDPNNYYISKLYSNATFQMIIIDSASNSVEIVFAPEEKDFPQHPFFIKIQ